MIPFVTRYKPRKNMMLRKILREVFVSLVLGAVPCFIVYVLSGVSGVEAYLKSIDVSDSTVYYFVLLSVFHLIVSIVGRWVPRHFDSVRVSLRFTYEVANEVGTSLLCLYRIITGSAIGCSLIALASYPELGGFKYTLVFALTALPFLWVCVLISGTYNHAKGQQLA
ncbi:hypothetical protein [Vibrio crassostreae]|nr:hypothetical protein [Vibrio crassostreae]